MRVAIRIVAWVLVFVALGAAAASWATPRFELDAADARDVALGALDSVGIEGTVTVSPTRIVHVHEDGESIRAWSVIVDIVISPTTTEQIELRVQRDAGHLVYVDDRIGPDDQGRALTEDQFFDIGEYRDDDRTTAWVVRNGAAAVAGAAVAGSSFILASRSDQLWSDS